MLIYEHDASGNMRLRTVNDFPFPPTIAGQPINQVAEQGDSVTFSVVLIDTAGPIFFQWRFNGTNIAGAIGDSLLLNGVVKGNEGQYSVVVSNFNGSVTSDNASLMVDSDSDGLPDAWEMDNFGDLTSQRSAGDPDVDGVSNLDEFLDGTDPLSNTSLRPRLIAYSDAGGIIEVVPMKLSYEMGETVFLTPTAFAPSVFTGWAGDLNDTSNPASLTMNGNKIVRAKFASAVSLPQGLVALWRGETDASDAIDGHHGTFFKGTTATTPSVTPSGKVGGAFSFDGTVHVEVPDSAELKPAQITLEAWVFPTLFASGYQTIITRGSMAGNDPRVPAALRTHAWYLGLLSEANIVSAGRPHFRTSSDILRAPEIPLNEWTHLAASFDGATKRLYVNGVLIASRGGLSALVYDPAAVPVTIGSDFASGPFSDSLLFQGRIDEVGIYNRALTSNEIVEIYNADLAGGNFSEPYFTSPPQLPDGVVGAIYLHQITTVLGKSPISFSFPAGSLPLGLTLSPSGLVTGSPSEAAIVGFTVRATDAAGLFNEQACMVRVL
jgi:hypothetical protein